MTGMADRAEVIESQTAIILAEVARLEAELATADLVVHGSRGQPVPNPLLAQVRQHRWLLARFLDAAVGPMPSGSHGPDVVDAIRAEWESS